MKFLIEFRSVIEVNTQKMVLRPRRYKIRIDQQEVAWKKQFKPKIDGKEGILLRNKTEKGLFQA